jgi:hypothetical protein
MLRFGLCFFFNREPIRFRYTTAKVLSRLGRPQQLANLYELCLANAESLHDVLHAVSHMGVGAFRVF